MRFTSSFTIQSDTRHLKPIREWLSAAAGLLGEGRYPRAAVMPCQLALTEAVDNAIFHAHDEKKELPITIFLEVADSRIVMEVIDTGEGIGDPDLPDPDELANHGRGIFIIKEIMSEVESRTADGKHYLRMVYHI